MNGTVTGIVIMCVVIVAALAALLLLVARAARRPGSDGRHVQPMRGLVQGGEHVGGGGRSVMPRRDAPVPEGGGKAPSPKEMTGQDDQAMPGGGQGTR